MTENDNQGWFGMELPVVAEWFSSYGLGVALLGDFGRDWFARDLARGFV